MAIAPTEIPVTVKVKVEFEPVTTAPNPLVVGGVIWPKVETHQTTLNTDEELADAPVGTVVIDTDGDAWQKTWEGWFLAGCDSDRSAAEEMGGLGEFLPAKVIYNGWGAHAEV